MPLVYITTNYNYILFPEKMSFIDKVQSAVAANVLPIGRSPARFAERVTFT